MSKKYKVYELDIWSGEEEGDWIKNDYFFVGKITLSDMPSDNEILEALEESLGYAKESNRDVDIINRDCEGSYFEIVDAKTGYPCLDLKRV